MVQKGLIGLIVFLLSFVAFGDTRRDRAYYAEIEGNLSLLARQWTIKHSLPLSLTYRLVLPRYGRSKLLFYRATPKNWKSYRINKTGKQQEVDHVVLLRGQLITSEGVLPIGGGVYKKKGKLFLEVAFSRTRSRSSSKGRMMNLLLPLSQKSGSRVEKRKVRIHSLPSAALLSAACGTEKVEELTMSFPTPQTLMAPLPTSLKVATIATDADSEYYALYGESTNAHIATLINSVNAIYESQLGVTLEIATQNVFTSSSGNPYTSTNSSTLLEQFRTYTETNSQLGSADLYHLFSGKDWDGTVIGLAYVGVVCAYPSYSYGMTQRFHDSGDASILAHELGHNFGASHDTSDSTGIMYPSISIPGSTRFSAASITAINSFVSSNPSCYDSSEVTPTATPTITSTATSTPTRTPTSTVSNSPTATASPTSTSTVTPTPTVTPTFFYTGTATPSPIPTVTSTSTPTKTVTPISPTPTEVPTSTTTPLPTATPTSPMFPTPRDKVPEATPTPTNFPPLGIQLKAGVFSQGKVLLTFVPEEAYSGCTISLSSSLKKRTLSSGAGEIVFSAYKIPSKVTSLYVVMKRRAAGTVYLQASYQCPATSLSTSSIVSLRPSRIAARKITLKKWYTAFVEALQQRVTL